MSEIFVTRRCDNHARAARRSTRIIDGQPFPTKVGFLGSSSLSWSCTACSVSTSVCKTPTLSSSPRPMAVMIPLRLPLPLGTSLEPLLSYCCGTKVPAACARWAPVNVFFLSAPSIGRMCCHAEWNNTSCNEPSPCLFHTVNEPPAADSHMCVVVLADHKDLVRRRTTGTVKALLPDLAIVLGLFTISFFVMSIPESSIVSVELVLSTMMTMTRR